MQNKGVARARLPSHLPRGRTRLAARQTAGPATLAPSQFCPQPPKPREPGRSAAHGHGWPQLIAGTWLRGPIGRGRGAAPPSLLRHNKHGRKQLSGWRRGVPARLLRPEGRDDPRPSNSCTMPRARPAGVPSLGSGVSWGGGRRGGRSTRWAENKSQGSSPPEASASSSGCGPF